MLEQNSRLYDEGFALHLLKPKSKMPVKSGWTKGPRSSLLELELDYKQGMNVGVRLGTPSQLSDGTFLAVIDCDVKSTDRKHQAEMILALEKIIPQWHKLPHVISGRGNGSRHIYIKTELPTRAQRLAQSKEKVEVLMPSTKPSKADIEALGLEKIAKGIRLRAAWEVSLMGDGQQVVLPPSIHPDSGEAYKWDGGISSNNDLRLFVPPVASKEKTEFEDLKGFEFSPVEVDISQLDEGTRLAIVDGVGVDDRSISLYLAAAAMVKVGFSDVEILSVLTNRENYLGQVAYEHCKSDNVVRAARWLARYTVASARKEYSCIADFEGVEVQGDITNEAVASAQEHELLTVNDWKLLIDRNDKGTPKNTLHNSILILENAIDRNIVVFDEFKQLEMYGCDTPWGGTSGEAITDRHVVRMKTWIADRFRYEPSTDKINEAITDIADRNKFHPVKQYLESLKWDGVPRVDTWIKDHFGSSEDPRYLSAVSRKVLCALIARIYEPGCKFDYVLTMEGIQGLGKSTAMKHLVGEKWFMCDDLNIQDKDSVLALRGKWLVEFGEMSVMAKSEIHALKAFITRTVDNIREPYGRRTGAFPRQCIFMGSTNIREYLKDETGNRRFWPVTTTGRYRFAENPTILKARDQLFAEAMSMYKNGEPLYFEDDSIEDLAKAAQGEREPSDLFIEQAQHFFENQKTATNKFPETFTMFEAMSDFGPFAGEAKTKANEQRIGTALRKCGFERKTMRFGDFIKKIWVKSP